MKTGYFIFWSHDHSLNFYSDEEGSITDKMLHDGVYQLDVDVPDDFPAGFEMDAGGVYPRVWNNNGSLSSSNPDAPTSADVNIERDRRIAAGNTFTVTGYGDIPLTGTERDQIVFQAQLTRASAYAAAGETGEVMVIRDALNTTHMLTPTECIELISKGMTWIESVMMTSWHMKDATGDFTDGIPTDYTKDSHWP